MKKATGSIWVIVEQLECRIRSVSLQLVGKARLLADQLGVEVEAIFLGHEIEHQTDDIIAAGADRVFLGDAVRLRHYQPEIYTELITDLALSKAPEILLIGSTGMGREIAPLVAARLATGLTAHCIDLVLNEDLILEQRIPAYGGLLSIVCPEKRPQMATAARGVFPQPDMDRKRKGEVVKLAVSDDPLERVETLKVVQEAAVGVPLESAGTVVAGGAGAGDAEGWQKIAELAELLNAALGCTRPAVDEGWAGLETMVGQSGKMVSPELYIGVGLSGELQHMVGITGARMMIAINKDSNSPVFEQVDIGVVDDCREFIPALIDKIKDYQEKLVTC
ncbi:electron transfer flavoprotein subunit alpha/FixB family protein [Desulfococcaceae bacterium HSG7]|nr:electron transfer flavoprotein subunit alpha/FixB family protein [Desulfococcaceae bacterium HSG7]